MPLFSRLSNAIWDLVAPVTGQKNDSQPADALAILQQSRPSMSPIARVNSWHLSPPAQPTWRHADGFNFASRSGQRSSPEIISPRAQPKAKQRISGAIAQKRSAATHEEQVPAKRPRGRPRKRTRILQSVEIDNASDLARSDARLDQYDDVNDDVSSTLSEIRVASHSSSPPSRGQQQQRRAPEDGPGRGGRVVAASGTFSQMTPRHSIPAGSARDSPWEESTKGRSPTPADAANTDLSMFPLLIRPMVTHLLRRGREPVFPSHWALDFKFLPAIFFCKPQETSVIGSLSDADFRAQRAFNDLLQLGAHIRDSILVGKDPELGAARDIQHYLSWCLKDAGIQHAVPPLVAFHHAVRGEPFAVLQRSIASKLLVVRDHWNEFFADLGQTTSEMPPIHAILSTRSTVVFICWAPQDGVAEGIEDPEAQVAAVEKEFKVVAHFDFAVTSMDVLNSLAVALLSVHVRDAMRGYVA
ncbi:hypothetical protein ANO11243_081480 [Dothideomycetidae sp. 11243]|nr:hypothetical protein ANO11243_081480 [fungal sp. No.11243]